MLNTVIRTFADVSSPIGSNLLLASPFGLISGRLSTTSVPTPEELDQISGKATVEEAASVTAALLATAKSNYGDAPVNGNDGYLALVDVVIKSSSGTTFFNVMLSIAIPAFHKSKGKSQLSFYDNFN